MNDVISDTERIVLGTAIQNKSSLALLMGEDVDLFTNMWHIKIFNAMCSLHEDNEDIDMVVLSERLKDTGNKVDDDVIMGLGIHTTINFKSQLRVLKKDRYRRQIAGPAEMIMRQVKSGRIDIEQFIDEIATIKEEYEKAGVDYTTLDDFSKLSIGEIFGNTRYFKTGIRGFDEKNAGIFDGNLLVIGGRPGHGKTTLAFNIVKNHIEDNFLFFSLEMTDKELLSKIISGSSNVEARRIETGNFREEWEMEKVEAVNKSFAGKDNIKIFYETYHLNQIINAIKKHSRHTQIKGAIVDYIQLVEVSGGLSDYERISLVSRGLKKTAQQTGVPIIALSQLNRSPANQEREPRLSDLRGSGTIEQDANAVWFIYIANQDQPGEYCKLITAKDRKGPTGETSDFIFNKKYSRFDDKQDSNNINWNDGEKSK